MSVDYHDDIMDRARLCGVDPAEIAGLYERVIKALEDQHGLMEQEVKVILSPKWGCVLVDWAARGYALIQAGPVEGERGTYRLEVVDSQLAMACREPLQRALESAGFEPVMLSGGVS